MVFGVTLVTFLLSSVVPADPATANLGQRARDAPGIVARYRAEQGLDRSLPVQYASYLGNLLTGDLGTSQQTQRPVLDDLAEKLPATLELVLAATVMALVVGVLFGVLAAKGRGGRLDRTARTLATHRGLPADLLDRHGRCRACVKNLGVLPGSGRLAPALDPQDQITGFYTADALLAGDLGAFASAAGPSRPARFGPRPVRRRHGAAFHPQRGAGGAVVNFVKAGRAKGLRGRGVLWGYAVRSASGQLIAATTLSFSLLLAATVYIEQQFSWNGIGQYAFRSSTDLDLPAVMGVSTHRPGLRRGQPGRRCCTPPGRRIGLSDATHARSPRRGIVGRVAGAWRWARRTLRKAPPPAAAPAGGRHRRPRIARYDRSTERRAPGGRRVAPGWALSPLSARALQVLYGARLSVPVGLLLITVTAVIGTGDSSTSRASSAAGSTVLMRVTDGVFAFGVIIQARSWPPRRRVVGHPCARAPWSGGGAREDRATACPCARRTTCTPSADGAADKYPHEFSGGQRQRAAIARALASRPKMIVADEPVSALDASAQAAVANLLRDLSREEGIALAFISHDLAVVGALADRVVVMYLGRIVETGTVGQIFDAPRHPYTRALLDAVPVPDGTGSRPRALTGEVPDPGSPPSGCRFHPRCPLSVDRCRNDEPVLRAVPGTTVDSEVACWVVQAQAQASAV
ncbi:Vitamin B12 import ATP-binding protein BtuD [Streptomyces tendae]